MSSENIAIDRSSVPATARPRRRSNVATVRWGLAALIACVGSVASASAQIACPSPAAVVLIVQNLSPDATVTVNVAGEVRDPTRTCEGAGDASYAATFTCTGSGAVRCGTIPGLRPGTWINRLDVTVAGSAPQIQAQQAIFLSSGADPVANVLNWTVYPMTFVVAAPTEAALRAQLAAADAYTAAHTGPALVEFNRTAFPGAATPQKIDLAKRIICAPDSRRAAICLTGSRLVIDGLDATAEPGAVTLSVGQRAVALLRVFGSDNVLRGLVFEGSTLPGLSTQADTVSFVGAGARRNRLEKSIVHGPSNGDSVSAETDAGGSQAFDDNVVDGCEVTGAEDRGLKVTTGARLTVRQSCIHDNHNGGVQSTLGGHVFAFDNLVQHNVPGPSDNGFSAGTALPGDRSTLVTAGNIVRFSGGRGIGVVDNADAVLGDDYVADNQYAGARIETLATGSAAASARLSGVTLACNNQSGISGTCSPSPSKGTLFCATDSDCCGSDAGCCVTDTGCTDPVRCVAATPLGFGAVVAACDGCAPPTVTLGDAGTLGRNALTLNANVFPLAQGANLAVTVPNLALAAQGNQWEGCGPGATCDQAAVLASDVQLATGASADVANAIAARADALSAQRLSIGRPRAGDQVRVFGGGFNAIDGADCAQTTVPIASCSTENPRVAQRNHASRSGNRLRLMIAGQTLPIDVDAVTPTMLAFRMPVDCFAPATLEVSKRNADDVLVAATIPFCDPGGCLDRVDGTPCDDRDECTTNDTCVAGKCVGGAPPSCEDHDPCTDDVCDPVAGCRHVLNTAPCDDGDACTTADSCSEDVCRGGPPRVCGPFLSCDSHAGCIPGRTDCRKPMLSRRAPLVVRASVDPGRKGLTWNWTAGAATTKADFGDPLTATDYMLSVYDGSGAQPILRTRIPAGGVCGTRKPRPCWTENAAGFRYVNPALTPDGVLHLVLRAGDAKKAKIHIDGHGSLLSLPTLPLSGAVTVQLERADGPCWDANYDLSVTENDPRAFKARGD